MVILGVDPALTVTGYGVIDVRKTTVSLIEAGVITTSADDQLPGRLQTIYCAINDLIRDTKPGCMVVEKIYAHYRHPVTSYLLGQARGVICLACATNTIPLFEYAATRVKKAIVGKGLASKQQVQKMVAKTLHLTELPRYTDVTDALALALTHSYFVKAQP